ncbi:LysR family transcriptional regulator [Dactylosporangium fulvum]|uniref:LysR family transcriptional regulator n=1 Tax=Dactylosporangium fulvum TaxID=53359 RepID=A0ABY5W6D4_9ACTN|nr:LysR family transcriptional regulator [Dactylosporangium fulvum]UWP84829.1 LysR family transcriptional regulator [Dactylosporangium fulvum]
MDVHVRDLRYFVAVAEELNFTRAASRLHVSQPALSKQIRQLELALRATLFDRGRRAITITAAGAALLPHAQRLIGDWDRARQEVAAVVSTSDSTLTVGFQTSIGRGLIPAVTTRMAQDLPGWQLAFRQIPWADPSAGLDAEEVDVAIAWLPVPAGGALSWRVVTVEDRWVALPVGHHLASRERVPFDALASEPFVALPRSAGALRDFWLASDHRESPATVSVTATTADETFEAVASGRGVALLAAGNAELYQRDDVVCRPVTGLSPSQLAVVWRTGDTREAVRVFTEACCRCV